MKSNKKSCGFVKNFKYIMLLPIVIALLAIVFGAVFGFNLDYDFRNVTTFNVKFNTTVTESEYKVLEKEVFKFVDEKYDDFRIDRIGENAQNGLIISIPDAKANDINDLKDDIKTNLLSDISDSITSNLYIDTTDNVINLPQNVFDLVLYSSLIILGIMLIAFVYTWIRYNFVASITIVLSMLFNIALLTSVYLVARIPLNTYFVLSYFVMNLLTLVTTTFINNSIKNNLNSDAYSKFSNSDRVTSAIADTLKWQIIVMVSIVVVILGIMFFGSMSLLYTALGIICGIIISVFTSLIFNTSLWSMWYKKDKDTMLRRRIEKENSKTENSDEEKILV